jgi:hypothetical protein
MSPSQVELIYLIQGVTVNPFEVSPPTVLLREHYAELQQFVKHLPLSYFLLHVFCVLKIFVLKLNAMQLVLASFLDNGSGKKPVELVTHCTL